jgi:predicted Zn-dependent protease
VSVKKFYLNSNTEYEKEDSVVNYLKKICEQINPFNVPLNIRIVRDPDLNACAFEDGTIYVNIGLLARYDNEAEIAAVLGHEIGHVIKQHNYTSYDIYRDIYEITFNNPYQNRGILSTYLSAKNAFNKLVKQEEESDDISIELLKKSNYNINALSTMVEKFMELEKKSNASIYNQSHRGLFYFRTHPATNKRYDKARMVETNNGKNFLVDSIYFERLKRWAIDETIYLNFLEQEFLTCVELAFNEYLKFPQDPYYLFYLTEANRRALAYYNISNILN